MNGVPNRSLGWLMGAEHPMARVALAFVLTPAAGMAALLGNMCRAPALDLGCVVRGFQDGAGILLLGYLGALPIGIPVFVLLRRRGWLHPVVIVAVTGAVAATSVVVVGLCLGLGVFVLWPAAFIGVACGCPAGVVFWLVGIWRNHVLRGGERPSSAAAPASSAA